MNSFFWTLAAEALVFTSILFAIFWYIAKKINNYGIVDIVWSYGFLAVVGFYVFLSDECTVRKTLLLIMVGTWSFRLGTFLFWRITKAHPEEDSRYQNLRTKYAPAIASKLRRTKPFSTLRCGRALVCRTAVEMAPAGPAKAL